MSEPTPNEYTQATKLARQMLKLVEDEDPTIAIGVVSGMLAAMINEVNPDTEDSLKLLDAIYEAMADSISSGEFLDMGEVSGTMQ